MVFQLKTMLITIRSIIKITIEFIYSAIIYVPFILYHKIKLHKINYNIIIIDSKYYDLNKKLLFNSDLTNSIQEYILKSEFRLNVKSYFPDNKNISNISAGFNFLNYFYSNKPKYIFFKSDWQDPKTVGISLFLFIFLKFLETKTTFVSISGDPHWSINKIRGWICKKVFNAHSYVTGIYIKKTKTIEPIAEYGIIKNRFYEPSPNRNGGIFYIGRLPKNDERKTTLNFLINKGMHIDIFGENSGNFLSQNQFYDIYKNYKITINFPRQVKLKGITSDFAFRGRVLDALSHGVLLFDQKNPHMDVLFKADNHYINYENENDLLEKLKYYSKNYDTAGIKIAQNGFNFAQQEYNSNKVWSNIFRKL